MDQQELKHVIALLLEDAKRLQQIETNAGTEARIWLANNALKCNEDCERNVRVNPVFTICDANALTEELTAFVLERTVTAAQALSLLGNASRMLQEAMNQKQDRGFDAVAIVSREKLKWDAEASRQNAAGRRF